MTAIHTDTEIGRTEIPPRARIKGYENKVQCPWCDSYDNRIVSPFGGTVSEILLKCNRCHNVFGWMKWEGKLPE